MSVSTPDRRTFVAGAAIAAGSVALRPGTARAQTAREPADAQLRAGRAGLYAFQAPPAGEYVNAYYVESDQGIVVVDSLLRVSDARELRNRIDQIGKPLLGLIITHGHTDHYGGATALLQGDDVPVVMTRASDAFLRAAYPRKDTAMRPDWGVQWETEPTFANMLIDDGGMATLGDQTWTVRTFGPGEAGDDGYWTVNLLPDTAFTGDLFYNNCHSYCGEGTTAEWLENLAQARGELAVFSMLCPGHGGIANPSAIDRQIAYLKFYRETVADLADGATELTDAAKDEAADRLATFLGNQNLVAFARYGLDPVAAELQGLHRPL